jgi:hypothetical protein
MTAVSGKGNQNPGPSFQRPSAESKQNRRFYVVGPIPKEHVKIPPRNIKIILAGGSLKPTIVKRLAELELEPGQCAPRYELVSINCCVEVINVQHLSANHLACITERHATSCSPHRFNEYQVANYWR